MSYRTEHIDLAIEHLREHHRVKIGVDYNFTLKFNKIHILVSDVYRDIVVAHMQESLTIASVHTYDFQD